MIIKKTRLIALSLSLCALLSLCGCNPPDNKVTPTVTPAGAVSTDTEQSYLVIPLTNGEVSPISACSYDLLHTVTTIQIYDSTDYDILYECFALIDRYEKIFSRTLEASEVYRINHGDGTEFTVSEELKDILEASLKYGNLSNGALDVSIAPVSSLWDFSSLTHEVSVPDPAVLQDAMALVDYNNISLSGNTLAFAKEGMQLELGAIAKGYIADRVKDLLISHGITSAVINLGGNILLVGDKLNTDATTQPFRLGIQKPFEDRDSVLIAICELSDVSMVSSGIYERYFYDEQGTFYHHILDSKTGYPTDTGLLQVTIISDSSATGDALSTSCFALGLEKGMELVHSLENVYAVFMTTDGKLHFSNGFLENIPTTIE